jgi:hypothetical protein
MASRPDEPLAQFYSVKAISVHLFELFVDAIRKRNLTGDAAALADVGASSRANCKATSARIPAGWLRLAARRAEWFFCSLRLRHQSL